MAQGKQEATQAATAVAVTPPPQNKGGRRTHIDPALLESMVELMKDGQAASDGKEYDSRQDAGTAAMRFKKGLVNANHYAENSEIRSRVWTTTEPNPDGSIPEDAKWVFGLEQKAK